MGSENEMVTLFESLQKGISKHGYKKVLCTIEGINVDCKNENESDICNEVITLCSNHYLVNRNDVLVSNKRGVVNEARKMCFVLLKSNLSISDSAIGGYVGGRSKQQVNRELKNIILDESKIRTKRDRLFYDDFVKLNNEVIKIKNAKQTPKNEI